MNDGKQFFVLTEVKGTKGTRPGWSVGALCVAKHIAWINYSDERGEYVLEDMDDNIRLTAPELVVLANFIAKQNKKVPDGQS